MSRLEAIAKDFTELLGLPDDGCLHRFEENHIYMNWNNKLRLMTDRTVLKPEWDKECPLREKTIALLKKYELKWDIDNISLKNLANLGVDLAKLANGEINIVFSDDGFFMSHEKVRGDYIAGHVYFNGTAHVSRVGFWEMFDPHADPIEDEDAEIKTFYAETYYKIVGALHDRGFKVTTS